MVEDSLFQKTIRKKMSRLEELARHHTQEQALYYHIIGLAKTLPTSAITSIIRYGFIPLHEKKNYPQTQYMTGIKTFDKSYGTILFRQDQQPKTTQPALHLATLLIDPHTLHKKMVNETTSKELGNTRILTVIGEITPKDILGGVIPKRGFDYIFNYLGRPSKKINIKEIDAQSYEQNTPLQEHSNNAPTRLGAFYRGFVHSMNYINEHAFPLFLGPTSDLQTPPYQGTEDNKEIPLDYYLAGQFIPFTPRNLNTLRKREMLVHKKISPRMYGLVSSLQQGHRNYQEVFDECEVLERKILEKIKPTLEQKIL